MFKNVFLTFYILQAEPPKHLRLRVTYPSALPFDGPGCVNNMVVNVFKKLMQYVGGVA